jgi:hypothetical protein
MESGSYSAQELLDLSEFTQSDEVELGAAGTITGVVMPRDFSQGEILPPAYARTLAAQLLRAADLHDAIYDNGYLQAQEHTRAEARVATRRKR